jgi:hypothetical protein
MFSSSAFVKRQSPLSPRHAEAAATHCQRNGWQTFAHREGASSMIASTTRLRLQRVNSFRRLGLGEIRIERLAGLFAHNVFK